MESTTIDVEQLALAVTLRSVLKWYIDEGNACFNIIGTNTVLFGHLSFVDWERKSLTLTILLAGVCPNYQTSVLRNVCGQHYVETVVDHLIKRKFPIVSTTKALLSTDPRFDTTVVQKGGSLSYPNFWTSGKPFYLCMKSFGDFYPHI